MVFAIRHTTFGAQTQLNLLCSKFFISNKFRLGLPCLLLLMIPIFVWSGLGWEAAMGAVLVIVVIVAAGIISADIT